MSATTRLSLCVVAAVFAVCVARPARADQTSVPAASPLTALPEDTSEVLVFLQPGTDVEQFAREHGLAVKHVLRSDPDAYVLTAASVAAARTKTANTAGDPRVRASYVNQRTHYVKMAFVPNDPFFHKDTPEAGYPGQWHLINEHTLGLDAGVQGAWNRDVTGSGVTIGFVDDCLQTTHPDLSPNYVAVDSWDFGENNNSPDPVYDDDMHGISTSGVATARGGNGTGVTGAAPYASLAGLRIDFYNQTTQMFVDATLYHSSGANTNIKVKNHSYGVNAWYVPTPAEESALATSTAAGTIHVLAAGNGRWDGNVMDLQNSPDAISVAALASDGTYAYYSRFGACVFVTAPSSGTPDEDFGITTTDRMGENYGYNGDEDPFPYSAYTSIFGGTSAAAPVVAGVMALGKQVQPNLNTRFAKHLLVRTCEMVDDGDPNWITNMVGYHFNVNYGFGLIDADAFTQLATQYSGVTPLTTEDTGLITVNAPIPDYNWTGVSRTFTLNSTDPLEEILVYLKITHPSRGNLEAFLRSPDGRRSRLITRQLVDYDDNIDWTFTTNEFWGENPHGTWAVIVSDRWAADTGTWNQFRVIARKGALIEACPNPPGVTSISPNSGNYEQFIDNAVIGGSNFMPGQTTVRLTSPDGYPDIVATDVNVAPDGNSLTCDFDLNGAPAGIRQLVANTTADCPNARLADAFTVTVPPCPNHPAVTAISPNTGTNDRDINSALIQGANFVPGETTVKLTKAGQLDIVATDVNVAPDGSSLTCDIRLYGAALGTWDLVVNTDVFCPEARLAAAFTVTQGGPPIPMDFAEQWDTYATGTGDANYVARWPKVPGWTRYTIEAANAFSTPNALKVGKLTTYGIYHDLAPELTAAVPGGYEVLGVDASPLELLFYGWLKTTYLDHPDMFVELSKGNIHAPAGNSPTVIPVLAFGWTYGLNGASWHPYYFDGQIWRKVDPITQASNWNFLFMRVRSTQVYLEGRESASGSVTYSRAYTGAFDRITIRTQSNDGSTRSFDDIYLDGGWVVTPPPDTPPTITQQPSNQNVCAGSTAQFTVTADGPGTLTYQWQKNSANFTDGGHYSGVTTAMLTISPADTTDVASYRCVVSNVGGSAISNQAALALKTITVADFDLDCDVDDADFLQFDACFTGPQVPGPPASGCTSAQFEAADSDGDTDVDQTDFAVFQRCYSGPNNPADPNCAN